jgi:low affinity Fe/Cu permease
MPWLGSILALFFLLIGVILFILAGLLFHDWNAGRIVSIVIGVLTFSIGIVFAVYSTYFDKRLEGHSRTKKKTKQ